MFVVALAAYVPGLVYLPDPGSRFPDWTIYLIVLPIVLGVLGLTQALTGLGALEFYRGQKHYPTWKQTVINISVLGVLAFMAMNVILIHMARHRIVE